MSARPDLSAMHRSELEATVVSQAKLMERFRRSIANIALDIEDEGDRAYFGSTNDADELRDVESSMLASLNILEYKWMHGQDLYAELAELHTAHRELLSIVERFVALPSGAWHPERHAAEEAELMTEAKAAIARAKGTNHDRD